MGIVWWIVGGLIVGLIAQLFVKGNHHLGCVGTVVLGIVGSLVGGTLISGLTGGGFEFRATGFIGSIFGAIVLLVVARLLRRSPNTNPR